MVPAFLINDGKLDQKKMKELRISIEDFEEQLRQLEIGSMQDIKYAIIETSGNLSVVKKSEKQQYEFIQKCLFSYNSSHKDDTYNVLQIIRIGFPMFTVPGSRK